MKESELELRDTKLAAMLGWYKMKGCGGDGDADSIYLKQGRAFLVERKRPKKKQQENQVRFEKMITESYGMDYYLTDDTDHEQMRRILLEQEEKHFPDSDTSCLMEFARSPGEKWTFRQFRMESEMVYREYVNNETGASLILMKRAFSKSGWFDKSGNRYVITGAGWGQPLAQWESVS